MNLAFVIEVQEVIRSLWSIPSKIYSNSSKMWDMNVFVMSNFLQKIISLESERNILHLQGADDT